MTQHDINQRLNAILSDDEKNIVILYNFQNYIIL